jgi:hypothetical protein
MIKYITVYVCCSEACITLHKRNVSTYFLFIVGTDLYRNPSTYEQLVYEFLFIWDALMNASFFNLQEIVAYRKILTIWLLPPLFLGCHWLPHLKRTECDHILQQSAQNQQHCSVPHCLVSFTGELLFSMVAILLWLNLKEFLCIVFTVRMVSKVMHSSYSYLCTGLDRPWGL